MNRILCPTDFSPAAKNATLYAARLARQLKASLTLVHIRVLAEVTPEEALVGVGWSDEDVVKSKLEEVCNEIKHTFKIQCEAIFDGVFGSAPRVIAAKKDFDLLIIGTNGEDNRFQAFFGSNAYQIVRRSRVPAIIVPDNCLYQKIKEIVFAYDMFDRFEVPLKDIASLARELKARVTVLQIIESTYERELGVKLDSEKKKIQDLYADDFSVDFKTLESSNVVKGIVAFVAREDPDLLALCINHNNIIRLLAKSIVRIMTAKPTVPLFIVHH